MNAISFMILLQIIHNDFNNNIINTNSLVRTGDMISYCEVHKLYPTSLSRAENTNIKRIKDKLINEIKNNLTTDLLKTFKKNDGYRNWEARFDNVWTPAIKEVHNQLTGKKKSESVFDKEVNHQKDFVKRIISNNGWGSVYYAYCHTNNELVKIDFNDSETPDS